MSASPPRVRGRWRHHGDRLAGLPTPFIQPERSSFRPGARRRSSLFGCVLPVSPPNRGGVNPQTFAVCNLRYDSVPRITLLTNYPTFCQQFRLKSDGDFLTLNFPPATLSIKNPRRNRHLGFLLTKGGVICHATTCLCCLHRLHRLRCLRHRRRQPHRTRRNSSFPPRTARSFSCTPAE